MSSGTCFDVSSLEGVVFLARRLPRTRGPRGVVRVTVFLGTEVSPSLK